MKTKQQWAAVVFCAAAALSFGGTAFAGKDGVAQLQATWTPIGGLTPPTRAQQACAHVNDVKAAAAGLAKQPPSGAAVDAQTWGAAIDAVAQDGDELGFACAAPDKKVHHIDGKVDGVDDVVMHIDGEVKTVLDYAKPRALPPALKKALAQIPRDAKHVCPQQAALGKLMTDLHTPAAGADATKWATSADKVGKSVDELKQNTCTGHSSADEDVAGAIAQIHDGLYELVVLVPAK